MCVTYITLLMKYSSENELNVIILLCYKAFSLYKQVLSGEIMFVSQLYCDHDVQM